MDARFSVPIVPVSVAAAGEDLVPLAGLIDSGSESVLAAGWLADATEGATIGIGGKVAEARFVEVELRLHTLDDEDEFVSWRADVGFRDRVAGPVSPRPRPGRVPGRVHRDPAARP